MDLDAFRVPDTPKATMKLYECLDGKVYVVGNVLTIADLTIASSLMYAEQTDAPLGDFPNIQSWFSRISDMDVWKMTNPR